MKKRKIVAGLLAAAAMLSIVTGCGQGTGADASTPGSAAPASGSGEKPTLKVLGFNAGFDPNKDIMASAIEEATGYHVEYSMLPAENADEKLNIELSSGSNYDIVKLTTSQYFKLVDQGALMPLDDLIDQYAPDIKKAVDEKTWKAVKYDGKTYALPMRKEYIKDVMESIIVRQDILDELGIPLPTTLDEFYDALKAIKQKKPDMIPFTGPVADAGTGANAWRLSPTVSSAFGIYTEWQDIDGKLVPMIKNPNMKAQLTFMNKLYNEGLIDHDWPVNTGAIVNEKFTSGKAVMAMTDRNVATQIIPLLQKTVPTATVGHILPLVGENGEQGAKVEDKVLYYTTIPKSSKNAVDAMKYLNAKQTPENFLFLTLGEEGKHFTKKGDEYIPIMPIFNEERFWSYWYLNTIDEENYPNMWLSRVRKSPDMWDIFEKVSLKCADIAKPDPLGYMPPNQEVAKYTQTLNKMCNDFYLKVIAGAEPVDSLEAFQAQWDNGGGKTMTEAVNKWYGEFYGK